MGCILGPPEGPKISQSTITSITEKEIEITTIEGIDQSGIIRETDRYSITYKLNEIEIDSGYKMGDIVLFTMGREKMRIENFLNLANRTEYKPIGDLILLKEPIENKAEVATP